MTSPELYHGLFVWQRGHDGQGRVMRPADLPSAIPCPTTGRLLHVATLEADSHAICPACASRGRGGFVSFEDDLRMAYACPACRKLVWSAGL